MTDIRNGAELATCASPFCNRTFTRAATGRRREYCTDNCRQDAHRERVRQAADAADRARQLAEAKSTAGSLWRPLEESLDTARTTASAVFEAVAYDPPGDLDAALTEYAIASEMLSTLAREYQAATRRITELEAAEQRAREAAQLRAAAHG